MIFNLSVLWYDAVEIRFILSLLRHITQLIPELFLGLLGQVKVSLMSNRLLSDGLKAAVSGLSDVYASIHPPCSLRHFYVQQYVKILLPLLLGVIMCTAMRDCMSGKLNLGHQSEQITHNVIFLMFLLFCS